MNINSVNVINHRLDNCGVYHGSVPPANSHNVDTHPLPCGLTHYLDTVFIGRKTLYSNQAFYVAQGSHHGQTVQGMASLWRKYCSKEGQSFLQGCIETKKPD